MLEQALAELTAALKENTAVQMELLGKVNDAGSTGDTDTGEAPKRERGKPSPGKSKRTAAEVAEDKAADEADAKAAGDTDDTATDDTGSDITFDGLKEALAKWLGEFAKKEDKENPDGAHPEVKARRTALKTLLDKLGAKQLTDVKDDAEKIEKLWNWLHEKGLKADKGFGIGRFAADPEPAGDEDLDI